MEEDDWSGKCRTIKISGSFTKRRPRKTWNEVISSGMKEKKVSKDLAEDRNVWESFISNRRTCAGMENRH